MRDALNGPSDGQDADNGPHSIAQIDYIAKMSLDLRKLAADSQLHFLAYLLDMVREEAMAELQAANAYPHIAMKPVIPVDGLNAGAKKPGR